MTAYARECERAGVRIPRWRDATGCKHVVPFKYSGEHFGSSEQSASSHVNATANEVLNHGELDGGEVFDDLEDNTVLDLGGIGEIQPAYRAATPPPPPPLSGIGRPVATLAALPARSGPAPRGKECRPRIMRETTPSSPRTSSVHLYYQAGRVVRCGVPPTSASPAAQAGATESAAGRRAGGGRLPLPGRRLRGGGN